jgi:chitin synthase
VFLCTWWAPNFILRASGISDKYAQQAWREKVTLFLIVILLSGFLLFYLIGLKMILCPDARSKSPGELEGSNHFVSLNGYYYSIDDITNDHVAVKQYLNAEAMRKTTLGRDVSSMAYLF